jgi:hypothetical protein
MELAIIILAFIVIASIFIACKSDTSYEHRLPGYRNPPKPPLPKLYDKTITEQELKDLKAIRNYFIDHDKTLFEHKAYAVLDRLIKKLS